ncbi:MAG: YdcF family protein [Bryobacteraceae bacterium]|nr:YdcF family protein [Bryobacteraceae bacterium]
MRFRRPAFLAVVLLLLVLAGLCLLTAPWWLAASARLLIQSDPPQHAQAILVLAGDQKGERVMKACELATAGLAPRVLVSGPTDIYGRNEANLAVEFAVKHGCPQSLLEPVAIQAFSTEEEASEFERELRARNITRLLIVTSNYHTARAGRIFRRRLGNAVEVRMFAAPDRLFDPDRWWQSREGQKTAFYEWSKTVSMVVGL